MAGLRKGKVANAHLRDLSDAEIERMLRQKQEDGSGQRHLFWRWQPYYKKGTKQESFQHKVLRCDAKVIALIAGNRTGKTEVGSRYVVARCLGFDPYYDGSNHQLVRRYQVPQEWWACTDGALVEQMFEKIKEMVPPAEVERIIEGYGRQAIYFKNGSRIKMKSYDQERRAYQGAKLHGIWNDEEPPEHIYLEQKTRLLDLGGIMLFTLTPIEGTTWLHEKLRGLDGTPEGRKCYERMSGNFAWFTGGMRENPHLSEQQVESYIDEFGLDEDAMAIRVGGKYVLLVGENAFGSKGVERLFKETRDPLTCGTFNPDGSFNETSKLDGVWRIFKERQEGMGYAIGADPAQGGELSDNTAAAVIEVATGEIVATLAGKIEPTDFAGMLVSAGRHFNSAMLVIEINNHGGLVQTLVRQMGYPEWRLYKRVGFSGRIRNQLETAGWKTDQTSKPAMVGELRKAIEDEVFSCPCRDTVNEMGTYVRLRKHEPGYHGYGPSSKMKKDDRCTAAMLAWQGAKHMQMWTDGGEAARARDIARATREQIESERQLELLNDPFAELDFDVDEVFR